MNIPYMLLMSVSCCCVAVVSTVCLFCLLRAKGGKGAQFLECVHSLGLLLILNFRFTKSSLAEQFLLKVTLIFLSSCLACILISKMYHVNVFVWGFFSLPGKYSEERRSYRGGVCVCSSSVASYCRC